MNFYITPEISTLTPELDYILKLWSINTAQPVNLVTSPDNSIIIGKSGSKSHLVVCDSFLNTKLQSSQLNKSCFFECEGGIPDYLATAFYMVTSLQERDDQNRDDLGRFKFSSSYQKRFNNVTDNVVQHCFDRISEAVKIKPLRKRTELFLTHDIDSVFGSIYEDGFYALKKGRLDVILKFLFQVVSGKPEWLNIDKILKMENEYDVRSVFYWIVNRGALSKTLKNADYNFRSSRIQSELARVNQYGFENGLHKSLSKESFQEEIKKFGTAPFGNRYHYLKFNLPDGYDKIEEANLQLDASLGFAEEIGFRNSYGLPFNPWNFRERRAYRFVEAPLHVMDRTFFQYKKYRVEEAERKIFGFFEKNKENCVLSVLWHNNFFSNYKYNGYLQLYKKILEYIKENSFETVSQTQLVERYGLKQV